MKTIYDVVKVKNLWYVCKLMPETNERWKVTSGAFKTRAGAFTEMHGQRFTDRDAVQLAI